MNDYYLAHHGVEGQKWGVRNGPPYPLRTSSQSQLKTSNSNLSKTSNPDNLSSWMKGNIGYSDYTKLKSAKEVAKTKSGSCHDQVMFELEELKNMGIDPKAKFMIEYDPKSGQGGVTHSFVYYENNGKTYWFENAWGGNEGVHEYKNTSDMLKDVTNKFKAQSEFEGFEMSDFGSHSPGETLQELVDIALSSDEVKHSVPEQAKDIYLAHHGVKGQKWGVRRYQNYDGTLKSAGKRRYSENMKRDLKSSYVSHLGEWGTSPDKNVCYVTGPSGSGKTTLAKNIARTKKDVSVIHLDSYAEPENSVLLSMRNKEFSAHLDKTVPNWHKMTNATKDGSKGTMKLHSTEYWKTVDQLRNQIEEFGKEQYSKGKSVIVEGVNIMADWLSEDKSFYKEKPMIVMSTDIEESWQRASKRDGIKDSSQMPERLKKVYDQQVNDILKTTDAKRSEEMVQDLIKKWNLDKKYL